MGGSCEEFLRNRLDDVNFQKLACLGNPELVRFLADAVELCNPDFVFVCTDAPEDIAYVREGAVKAGEETPLNIQGHTVHFDGYTDQGRDKKATKYLVPPSDFLSKVLNQVERDQGLAEVRGFLNDAVKGRTMLVRFLCLGPTDSVFSIPCVQCTDSFYVAHSEDLLYRPGYEQFRRLGNTGEFIRVLHSAGKLDERMASAEPEKRRIYIDYSREIIYSVNTQYAGNTVGLKKLALRLTIRAADRNNWLAEHMFLMGVHGPNGRKTYFAGAFPSACGKTSTAMLRGETILGDDIAFLRNIEGEARGVNAESGIFGIIKDVGPTDDPAICEALTTPNEVIFSNVLIKDGRPYWLGMDCELPKDGVNFSGDWHLGKVGPDGKEVPTAHKNARYTIALRALPNLDSELDNPQGVPVGAIIYGGRDAHAALPVQQSFSWDHGIICYGASLETETTFATIGKEGVPEINLMSVQDFLAIPLGKYIRNNLEYGRGLKKAPLIFGVNYFLRDKSGEFVNAVRDKAVWIKWMELRVHNDAGAVKGPTGWIPKHADLKPLFKQVLDQDYPEQAYVEQFTLRVPENLAKLERAREFHRSQVTDAPPELADLLDQQRRRLLDAQKKFGDYISPLQSACVE